MKGFLRKMTGSTVDNHTRDCTWSTCKGGKTRKNQFSVLFFFIMAFFLVSSVSSQQKPPRFEKPG